MKKIIVFFLLVAGLMWCGSASAQGLKLGVDGLTFKDDTSKVNDPLYAHSVISIKKKNYEGKRSTALVIGGSARSSIDIFELGWNMVDPDTPGSWFDINNSKSAQVTVNPFIFSATNYKNNFGFSMALGIRANNYRFYEPLSMEKRDGAVYPVNLDGKVKKSKFATVAIHVPMEITFGKPRRLAFSVGGFADFNFNSHTKVKYYGGSKDKVRNFPVNFLQTGFTARISFKFLSLYCNYTPVGLFKESKGPKMQVWSVGIGI